jgi:hypothetical protein
MCFAAKDFSCCNRCGHTEIYENARDENGDHNSCYVFYHDQETQYIYKQIEEGAQDIVVHLCFGAFDLYDDEERIKMIKAYRQIKKYIRGNNDYNNRVKLSWNRDMGTKMVMTIKSTANIDNYSDYSFCE